MHILTHHHSGYPLSRRSSWSTPKTDLDHINGFYNVIRSKMQDAGLTDLQIMLERFRGHVNDPAFAWPNVAALITEQIRGEMIYRREVKALDRETVRAKWLRANGEFTARHIGMHLRFTAEAWIGNYRADSLKTDEDRRTASKMIELGWQVFDGYFLTDEDHAYVLNYFLGTKHYGLSTSITL